MSSQSAVRLAYSVTSVSSSDASHASLSSPNGWQSARGCSYPQSLTLWLGGQCEVRKVQLLSHQSKIARTVELYAGGRSEQSKQQQAAAGRDDRAEAASWQRLGFFSLDANDKSQYKARELKCEWLRVLLKGCHANPLNVDGQVGIVALHVLGQPLSAAAPSFAIAGQPSPQPQPSFPAASSSPAASFAQSELDASTLQYLSHLQQLKAAAIEAEDFDSAKAMKARIDRLLGVVPRIVECERRKRDAIAREEYDEAKQCKLEADRLREAALRDRDVKGGADESKEDRSELGSARSRRRESRHVVDMPEVEASQQPHGASSRQSATVAALPDDDRPIRPAKQSSGSDGHAADAGSAAVDERPVHARPARGKDAASKQPASSDEDSFPVSHAAAVERPLRPARSQKAATNGQPSANTVSEAEASEAAVFPRAQGADPNDDRALPVSTSGSASYAFDSSDDSLSAQAASAAPPTAEPLSSAARLEAEPLIALLGIELTQSLYSRHWQLRADAVQLLTQLVQDEASPLRAAGSGASVSLAVLLRDMARVLQRTLTDKAAQVFVHACRLLEVVMKEAGRGASGGESAAGSMAAVRDEVRGLVESVARAMADRLTSSNAREREQSSQLLVYLALHKLSPAAVVPAVLLAPLKKSAKDASTPLRARCLVLQSLVRGLGVQDSGALPLASLLKFAQLCLSHRDAGVRDSAFNLVALACQQADRKKIDAALKDIPASTLASLDQRIADVRDGRYSIATAEVTDRPLDDRGGSKEQSHFSSTAAAASSPVVSPRTDAKSHGRSQGRKLTEQPAVSNGRQAEADGGSRSRADGSSTVEGGAPRRPQPSQQRASDGRSLSQAVETTAESGGVDGSYSADEYEGEHTASPRPASHGQPAGVSGDAVESEGEEEPNSAAAPNAGSPSHYRLSHAHEAEQDRHSEETASAAATRTAAGEASAAEFEAYPALLHACQFCGLEDESFTEDALDLHYWQACPMLLSCPHCEQVVEIPTFAEHLTSECEAQAAAGQWVACSSCGWVVSEGQLAEHEAECGGVRSGWVVCQLCCKDVPGSEDGWRQHLLADKCAANSRTNGEQSAAD